MQTAPNVGRVALLIRTAIWCWVVSCVDDDCFPSPNSADHYCHAYGRDDYMWLAFYAR